MKISAEVVADSINMFGDRITSMVVTMPRFILAEFNTHRVFSRNSASSRAIPFKKMVEMVEKEPFVPYAWQKDHKGMQGNEYVTDPDDIQELEYYQRESAKEAIRNAQGLHEKGVTKQLANRYLEPFMWHRVLVTSTEWENFFQLRCPRYDNNYGLHRSRKDAIADLKKNSSSSLGAYENPNNLLWWLSVNKGQAEIHMMFLAEAMWDALNESTPRKLEQGEWHIPFEDKMDLGEFHKLHGLIPPMGKMYDTEQQLKIKVSTGMSARTSYTTVGDEKEVSYSTLVNIHDKMVVANPFHASPFEHCAQVMGEDTYDQHIRVEGGKTEVGWCRNYKGFIQYRAFIESGKTL